MLRLSNKLKSFLLFSTIVISAYTINRCGYYKFEKERRMRYMKQDSLKLKMSIDTIVEFAEKTNQLEHVDSILAFYRVTLDQYKKKNVKYDNVSIEHLALLDTFRTYDLSWHKDYRNLFEKYYEEKQKEKFKNNNRDNYK